MKKATTLPLKKTPAPSPVWSRVMGVETEYGFSVLGPSSLDVPDALDEFLALACTDLVNLPCRCGGGLYLGNGARFYIDSGCHPEYCTPEVGDPAQAVRYLMAGDRLLKDVALKWERQRGNGARMVLFKCNVDYGGAFTTWACHESYSHRAQPQSLPPQLIPHLVSRIIYTGAGGLNPFCPGIQLCLSPRAYHLQQEISENSTNQRGIYHVKNESLAGDGWNRLHVLCGDSVFSHRANYLKMGTTALVLALADAGRVPAQSVSMREPLKALKLFNEDLSLTRRVRLADGHSYRAIDIQRRLLEQVEQHLECSFMPSWAPEVCRVWRETLDELERGAQAVAPMLDWSMKATLYRDFIRQQGFDPDTLNDWNQQVVKRVGLKGKNPEHSEPTSFENEEVTSMINRITSRRRSSGTQTALNNLSPEQQNYIRSRESLCELDVRFSWIGSDGIFASLEKSGQLNHRIPGLTEEVIEKATHDPPESGRARLRGNFVREHDRTPGYACDWMMLQSPGPRFIDLHDPAADQLPKSRSVRRSPREHRESPSAEARRQLLMEHVWQNYTQGEYERGYHKLLSLPMLRAQLNLSSQARFHELLVRLQARRGFGPDALSLLGQQMDGTSPRPQVVVEFINVLRFDGLVPSHDSFWDWIERGRRLQDRMGEVDLFAFRGHHGFGLGRSGRVEEGVKVLQEALCDQVRRGNNPRLYARTLANLADLWRMLGETSRAQLCLAEAEQLQIRHSCKGDLAEFTLATKAKLSPEKERAKTWLNQARSIQTELNHRPGLGRTLLLEARLDLGRVTPEDLKESVQSFHETLPSLARCPVIRKILDQWTAWTSGAMVPGEQDHYWGL